MLNPELMRRLAQAAPQPKTTQTKEAERRIHANRVAEFLAAGGQITKIAPGVSGRMSGPQGIVINNREDTTIPRAILKNHHRSAKNEQ